MICKFYELGIGMFGMCVYDLDFGFLEYGIMFFIDKMELFFDGCLIIQIIVMRRFCVMLCGMIDGYNIVIVQWFEDDVLFEFVYGEVVDLDILSIDCRKYLWIWFSSLMEV